MPSKAIAGWAAHRGRKVRRMSSRLAIVVRPSVRRHRAHRQRFPRFYDLSKPRARSASFGRYPRGTTRARAMSGHSSINDHRHFGKSSRRRSTSPSTGISPPRFPAPRPGRHQGRHDRRGFTRLPARARSGARGRFRLTPVDGEILLPHNMARHGLPADEIGSPKAPALARQISALLNEPARIIADVLDPAPTRQRR